jgi:hypothetical protein
MPRYFFSIEDHVHQPDTEGVELAGHEEARVQAIVFAGSVLRDEPGLVWDGHELVIHVTSEAGDTVVDVVVNTRNGGSA